MNCICTQCNYWRLLVQSFNRGNYTFGEHFLFGAIPTWSIWWNKGDKKLAIAIESVDPPYNFGTQFLIITNIVNAHMKKILLLVETSLCKTNSKMYKQDWLTIILPKHQYYVHSTSICLAQRITSLYCTFPLYFRQAKSLQYLTKLPIYELTNYKPNVPKKFQVIPCIHDQK